MEVWLKSLCLSVKKGIARGGSDKSKGTVLNRFYFVEKK
jgi:hypothetical protein